MYYTTDYVSPVGRIKLAADGERLVGLWPVSYTHLTLPTN